MSQPTISTRQHRADHYRLLEILAAIKQRTAAQKETAA